MSITKAFPSNPVAETVVEPRDIAGGPSLRLEGLTIGGDGVEVTGVLSGTSSWNPGAIANGASASKTISVAGAAVGNTVKVGIFPALAAGMLLTGQVTAADTVTVTLGNLSGGSVTPSASSNVRVEVAQYG
jgi:hypothetical protein